MDKTVLDEILVDVIEGEANDRNINCIGIFAKNVLVARFSSSFMDFNQPDIHFHIRIVTG